MLAKMNAWTESTISGVFAIVGMNNLSIFNNLTYS